MIGSKLKDGPQLTHASHPRVMRRQAPRPCYSGSATERHETVTRLSPTLR
jgi:hypothetical protein